MSIFTARTAPGPTRFTSTSHTDAFRMFVRRNQFASSAQQGRAEAEKNHSKGEQMVKEIHKMREDVSQKSSNKVLFF